MHQPSPETIMLVVLAGAVVALAAHHIALTRRLRRMFTGNEGTDIAKAFDAHARAAKKMERVVKQQHDEIAALRAELSGAVQKIRVLRFNSFEENGANQSFSVALLDGNDNGVVLTSLHMRDAVRLYAKPVERGTSAYALSQEEEAVLAKAKQKS